MTILNNIPSALHLYLPDSMNKSKCDVKTQSQSCRLAFRFVILQLHMFHFPDISLLCSSVSTELDLGCGILEYESREKHDSQFKELKDNREVRKTKITPKARCVIICEVAKDPRVTSNQLKAILTLVNVNIHESTIRKRLSNHRVNSKFAMRKPLLSKNNIAACLPFAKDHLDKTRVDKLCV